MAGPSYMSQQQMKDYLNDLRSPKIQRPTGSRPFPGSSTRSSTRTGGHGDTLNYRHSLSSFEGVAGQSQRSTSTLSKRQSLEPTLPARTVVSPGCSVDSSASRKYVDGDQRQKEKLESQVVGLALEGMDLEQEEKIHAAARVEAERLIWKHKNPDAGYRLGAPTPTIEPNRTLDLSLRDPSLDEAEASKVAADELKVLKRRSSLSKIANLWHPSSLSHRRKSSGQKRSASGKHKGLFENPADKIYEDPGEREAAIEKAFVPKEPPVSRVPPPLPIPSHVRKNPFARAHSRKSIPAAEATPRLDPTPAPEVRQPAPTIDIRRGPEGSASLPRNNDVAEIVDVNEGIKYRDGVEVRSNDLRAATSFSLKNRSPRLPSPTAVSDSSRRPIVSFKPDWTPPSLDKNTSKQSTPNTSIVQRPAPMPRRLNSDLVSEPIKAASAPTVPTIGQLGPTIEYHNGRLVGGQDILEQARRREEHRLSRATPSGFTSPVPSINVSKIPSINVTEVPSISVSDVPSINISEVPTINVSEVPSMSISPAPSINISEVTAVNPPSNMRPSPRHLPHPSLNNGTHTNGYSPRPSPTHSSTAPSPSRSTYTSQLRRPTALCAQCALPISGRIVTAASTRFHPSCFICHTCATPLECVAFYPEPDDERTARLSRIAHRAEGVVLPMIDQKGEPILDEAGAEKPEDETAAERDGDDGLRFYCHLDFHETFSPRCKSCKTPIEGEVVLACGAEYHVGHFFCAECGDPFSPSTPYIPKDGHAWCLRCHTRCYSPRCRACLAPVTDTVLRAEGAEWHEACFVCLLCAAPFGDEGYFLHDVEGDGPRPVCVGCEERRLKA